MRTRKGSWIAVCLGTALAGAGCTMVTDLDAYEQADAGMDAGPTCMADSTEQRDLVLELRGMTPHVDQPVEVRIVSTDSPPVLKAIGRFEPLGAVDVAMEMPGAIPSGMHRIDFFADVDGSGGYTPPSADGGMFIDHSWTIDPCVPTTDFEHNFNFSVLESPNTVGSDATIDFTNMPTDPALFELRIIEEGSEATVGFYRAPSQNQANFTVTLPGIMDSGLTYTVAFYRDTNGNQTYDAPPEDEAWALTGLSPDVAGLNAAFDYDPTATEDISSLGF